MGSKTQEGSKMWLIRNQAQKVICAVDAKEKSVEILHRGIKTRIKFKQDGTIEVIDQKTT